MSRRAARWWLFGAALLTVPLPFYLGAAGSAPVLRIAFLSALLTVAWGAEGGANAGLLVLLGWGQVLGYAGLLLLAAALLARLLARAAAGTRRALVLLTLVGLLGASLFPIYDTPLSSSGLRSSLLGLLD